MPLTNKVALVTGGAHRIGKAMTMQLAQMGAHVVVNYNSSDSDAKQTVFEAEALGVEAMAVQCDVSDRASVVAMADAILDRFGGIDVIVNGASLFHRLHFPTQEEAEIETWQRVTRILLDGTFYVCNALTPSMVQRAQESGEAGLIINISDLSAWYPSAGYIAHSTGKAGLLALTRQMALELAPHVRVNAIAPGPVLPPPKMSEKAQQRVACRTLLDRWGSPKDVQRAIQYLVEAEYVTGDVLTVDGGERYGHMKPGW